VQCAYLLQDEATVAREFTALEAIADNYTKVVVSMDEIVLPSRNGILHVQARNFEHFLESL
jgi:predicted AAA+ superfamily ATPase